MPRAEIRRLRDGFNRKGTAARNVRGLGLVPRLIRRLERIVRHPKRRCRPWSNSFRRSKGLRMSPSVGRCAVKFLVVVYNDNRNSITTCSAKTRNLFGRFRSLPFLLYFPSVFYRLCDFAILRHIHAVLLCQTHNLINQTIHLGLLAGFHIARCIEG